MTIKRRGFTLAELLIALAILGVIATFTIPKILTSTGNNKYKAVGKEAASMIGAMYQDYSLNNTITSTTHASDLLADINYVKVDPTGTFTAPIDGSATLSTCATTAANAFTNTVTTVACLALHNGGYLEYKPAQTFGGTTNTNYIPFNVDPDGTSSGAGGGTFYLYYNGRLTTVGNKATGSATDATNTLTEAASDPSWISSWN